MRRRSGYPPSEIVVDGALGSQNDMIVATEPTLKEAAAAHRKPFLWLPPSQRDLVTADDVKRLARDYKNFGKPLMLAERGTAGIYPAETYWLIPDNVPPDWTRKQLAPLIAISDLLPDPTEAVFFHSGDLGDICAGLPAIRQLGGGRLIIGHVPSVRNRECMRGARFEAIKPLLEAQPYITSVEYDDAPAYVMHDLSLFRHDPRRGESLAHWQGRHLGISELDVSPWISVPQKRGGDAALPDQTGTTQSQTTHSNHHQNQTPSPGQSNPAATSNPLAAGPVVMSRSSRYHNPFFPWQQILHKKRPAVFVGLPEEHRDFEARVGKIAYCPTADLLELAQVIAGASLFVGNQSLPFWIAAGLGVPLIQESWEYDLNSVIERPNAIYTTTGPESRTLVFRI